MNTKQLRAFYLAATHGTLTSAAAQLKLTLPAVSTQIRKLEEELKISLFDHHANRVILTTQGASFLGRVGEILHTLDRAIETAAKKPGRRSEKISISLGTGPLRFFSPAIASFVKKHPGLNIAIFTRSAPAILSQVMAGEVDIGVGCFGGVPGGIHKEDLFETGLWLTFPLNHPLAKKEQPGLRDMAAHRLVIPLPGLASRDTIDYAFSSKGINLDNTLEVSRCDVVIEFVRMGLGAGLIHAICRPPRRRKEMGWVDTSELFGKEKISLTYRRSASLTPAHHDLINTLVRHAKKER